MLWSVRTMHFSRIIQWNNKYSFIRCVKETFFNLSRADISSICCLRKIFETTSTHYTMIIQKFNFLPLSLSRFRGGINKCVMFTTTAKARTTISLNTNHFFGTRFQLYILWGRLSWCRILYTIWCHFVRKYVVSSTCGVTFGMQVHEKNIFRKWWPKWPSFISSKKHLLNSLKSICLSISLLRAATTFGFTQNFGEHIPIFSKLLYSFFQKIEFIDFKTKKITLSITTNSKIASVQ